MFMVISQTEKESNLRTRRKKRHNDKMGVANPYGVDKPLEIDHVIDDVNLDKHSRSRTRV